jgi:hypothetical protein
VTAVANPAWGYMKSMVYEGKVDSTDGLLQRIFDAARRINDVAVRYKSTLSVVEGIWMCIQADGDHFEQLLNWIVQSYLQ